MTEEAETRPTPTLPVADPAQTTPEPEVEPLRQEDELRCTLCGLRACWTT